MNHRQRGFSEQKNSNRINIFNMNNQNINNIIPINLHHMMNNMNPKIMMVNS